MTDFAKDPRVVKAVGDYAKALDIDTALEKLGDAYELTKAADRVAAINSYRAIAKEHEIAAAMLDDETLQAGYEGRHDDAKRFNRMARAERQAAIRAHNAADNEMVSAYRATLH